VGKLLRLFVMDVGWKEGTRTPMVCINPEVVDACETVVTREEGCLSIPGVMADVTRPDAVTLAYTDAAGRQRETRLTGFAAACAQHELDHLDGIVTFDRVDADQRAALEAAYGMPA